MTNHTPSLSEKELLTDLLTVEKTLVKDYASGITESACPNLRQLLIANLSECSVDQYTVFDQMRSRNMYKVKGAPQNEVQTVKDDTQTLKQQTGI